MVAFSNNYSACAFRGGGDKPTIYDPLYPLILETSSCALFIAILLTLYCAFYNKREHNTHQVPDRLWSHSIRNLFGLLSCFLWSLSFLEGLFRWKYSQPSLSILNIVSPILSLSSSICILVLYELMEIERVKVILILLPISLRISGVVARLWSVFFIIVECHSTTSVYTTISLMISFNLGSSAVLDIIAVTKWYSKGNKVQQTTVGSPGENPVSCDVESDSDGSLSQDKKVCCGHDSSNICSAISFSWYWAVVALGYNRPIEFDDIGSVSEEHSSSYQFERFYKYYETQKSIWKSFLHCYWKKIVIAGFLKLFGDLSNVVGPLAILPIVNYVRSLQEGDEGSGTYNVYLISWHEFLTNGWVLAWLALIASLMQSVFSQNSTSLLTIEGIHARSALQLLIYKKSLRVSMWSKEECDESRTYSEKGDAAKLINLSSDDVDNILGFFTQCHYIWAIPVKMTVLILLLYRELGSSAVYAAIVTILGLLPLQLFLIKNIASTGEQLATAGDDRLRKTHEVVTSMKNIKVNGWESLMLNRVFDARKIELSFLLKDSILRALMTFLTQSSGIVIILAAFGFYSTIGEDYMDAGKVFSSLALFSQLTVPLFILPSIIAHTIKAMRSVSRIEQYLNKGEADGIKEENKFDGIPTNEDQNLNENGAAVIRMSGASFHGEVDSVPLVKDISTDILKGQLTVILGEVGSGKTSYLLSMLGELRLQSGEMQWKRGETIAYVSQHPWLLNCTLKENILFGRPYKDQRYKKVLAACCLNPDINILPYGDETDIGEQGINLSGGQRQRVAIARALYYDASIIIMDSPFSALDAEVAKAVFESSISKYLLRKGKTVILTTQNQSLASSANLIIYMENGTVLHEGTPRQLMTWHPQLFTDLVPNAKGWGYGADMKSTNKERNTLRRITRIFTMFNRRKSAVNTKNENYTEDNTRMPGRGNTSAFRHSCILGGFPSGDINSLQSNLFTKPVWEHASSLFRSSSESSKNDENKNQHRKLAKSLTQVRRPVDNSKFREPLRRKNTIFFNNFFNRQPFGRRRGQRHRKNQSISLDEAVSINDEEETNLSSNMQVYTTDLGKEERERGKISKQNYRTYFQACGFWIVSCYVASSLLNQGMSIGIDIWMGMWSKSGEDFANSSTGAKSVNEAFEHENLFYLKGFSGLSVSSIVIVCITICFAQFASYRGCKKLYRDMMESVVFATPNFLQNTPYGRIINRFSADAAMVDKELGWALMHLVFFGLLCGSSILVNVVISPIFIIFSIPICFIYYIIQHVFRASSRELKRMESLSRSPLFGLITDTAASPSTIRAFGISDKFSSCYSQRLDAFLRITTLFHAGNRWLGINLDFMGSVVVFLATIACLIGSIVNFGGTMTPAKVGMALKYTLAIPVYLNWLVRFLSDTEMCLSSVERIRQYISLQPEDEQNAGFCKDYVSAPIKTAPLRNSITFDSVSLYYNKEEAPIMSNLSLYIREREKVGICGRTGSGKSTILMAVLRLVEKQEGSISIGNQKSIDISLHQWRGLITTSSQDGNVFNASIRFNVDPYHLHSDEEILSALNKVKLSELIGVEHLESVIGTDVILSPGQKQLLGLARVILEKKSIVLLDEATSSLDSTMDDWIIQMLISELSASTVICVSHSVHSLRHFDRILVLSDGRIAEDGEPHTLSKNDSSLFSNLLHQ